MASFSPRLHCRRLQSFLRPLVDRLRGERGELAGERAEQPGVDTAVVLLPEGDDLVARAAYGFEEEVRQGCACRLALRSYDDLAVLAVRRNP